MAAGLVCGDLDISYLPELTKCPACPLNSDVEDPNVILRQHIMPHASPNKVPSD